MALRFVYRVLSLLHYDVVSVSYFEVYSFVTTELVSFKDEESARTPVVLVVNG